MKKPTMTPDEVIIAKINEIMKTNPTMTEKQIDRLIQKEVNKHLQKISRQADMCFAHLVENMGENNDTIETLIKYLTECDHTYAAFFRNQNRHFIKWALQRNIDHNKQLIKALTKIEKKHDLPTHPSENDE